MVIPSQNIDLHFQELDMFVQFSDLVAGSCFEERVSAGSRTGLPHFNPLCRVSCRDFQAVHPIV
jgi:hypothetical protein